MTALTNQNIKDSYKDLLQISNSNAGVDGTVRTVTDGEDTSSALKISSSQVNCANITFNGSTIDLSTGSTITVTPNITFSGTATIATFACTTIAVSTSATIGTTLAVTGAVTLSSTLAVNNLLTSANTISASDSNGNLTLAANGTGFVGLGQTSTTGVKLIADQPLLDSSANEFLKFTKTSSAVNEFTISNQATGTGPQLSVTGSDSNIDVNFQTKGTGLYVFKGTADQSARTRWYEDTDNGSNYIEHQPPSSITGNRTVSWPDTDISTHLVQRVSTSSSTLSATVVTISYDNTIPQNTEGVEYLTLSITPKHVNNILKIQFSSMGGSNGGPSVCVYALFQDSTADALCTRSKLSGTSNEHDCFILDHIMAAGTTSSTTFKIRFGTSNGAISAYMGSGNTDYYGATIKSYLSITEYSA